MVKKKYEEQDGVWRTIGGRRVFIRKGQDLSSAMKESGKFKTKMNEKAVKGVREEDLKDQYIESLNNVSKMEYNGEITRDEYDEAIKNINKEYKNRKMGDKFYTRKDGTKEYELYKRAKENPDSIDPMTENSTDWEALDKKYGNMYKNERDNYESKYLKARNEEIRYERALGEYKGGKDVGEKIKKTGNDYLPKESKITTQGTSNRKEVSDNIQAHILSHYDNPVDFMEQMDNMDYLPTRWHAGEELAKGGSYLIYTDDQRKFLDGLNINPKGKTFGDDKVSSMYNSLVGRESEHLYNRLEKLFEQYKKEHKNSNTTLDDFRKWFK